MAKKRVGKFPKAFRQYAVMRLKQCDNIVALSKELGVHRRLLYTWRDQLTFPRFHRHLYKEEQDEIGGQDEHQDQTAVYGRV